MKNHLFTLPILISLFLVALVGVVFSRYAFYMTPKHQEEYAHIMAMVNETGTEGKTTPYQARQDRQNVHKDLLVSSKGERLQFHISSDQSELLLNYHEGKAEVVEHMHGVHSWMQEKVFYLLPDGREVAKKPSDTDVINPQQIVRCFEADTADYHYKRDTLTAQQVKMARYILSGHHHHSQQDLTNPLMEGTAESVDFSPTGKNRKMKAHKLKARLYSSWRLS